MGLAPGAAPEILPNYRCLPAERLEFADHEEDCLRLLANDGHRDQDAGQHPAGDDGRRRALDALGHHDPTL